MMHFFAVGETFSSVSCCSCCHSPSLHVVCYFLKNFKIAIANNVTTHCASVMPPSMFLLVVANGVDCYFAVALVCDYENSPNHASATDQSRFP